MGGDEFLAVLPGMPEDAVRGLMNAFEERMERLQEKREYPFRVQSSIGAYQVKLREGISLNQCILRSDKMMYEIKRQRHEKGSPR